MLLIGMLDSPFVRRVAVAMKLLGLPYEHRSWSVGRDFEKIRAHNPLGRVPTLVLDPVERGEALIDSAAILDHLDELVGERALTPKAGPDRRRALQLVAIATGAAEKGVSQLYERAFRPPEKRHQPWVERCARQVEAALVELDRAAEVGDHLVAGRFTQADLTVACVFTFLDDAGLVPRERLAALRAHASRFEVMPEMRATRTPFVPPAA
jgi:glutathione S-transferase